MTIAVPSDATGVRGPPGDVVCDSSTLTVRDVREGDERGRVRDRVGLLDGIADRVDVGIVRLVRLVDADPPRGPSARPAASASSHVGPHADRADNEVGGKHPPVGERHRALLDRCDRRSGLDVDAVRDELVGDEDRELRIQWRQHLRGGLDDRHVDALPDEVLGHLESDESGADHDRGRWCDVDVGEEAGRVFDGPQCASPVISGDRGPHRRCAHAEHELVVAEQRSRRR